MKVTTIIFCSILLFASCKEDKKAENVLSSDKMLAILTDIYLLEGAYNQNMALKFDTAETPKVYAEIFNKHKVNYPLFIKSYDYYYNLSDTFLLMHENLIEKLNQMQIELNANPDTLQNKNK